MISFATRHALGSIQWLLKFSVKVVSVGSLMFNIPSNLEISQVTMCRISDRFPFLCVLIVTKTNMHVMKILYYRFDDFHLKSYSFTLCIACKNEQPMSSCFLNKENETTDFADFMSVIGGVVCSRDR